MKFLKSFLLLAAVLVIGPGAALAAEPINERCPVRDRDVKDKETSEVVVNFCCERCKGRFDAAPLEMIDKVAEAKEGECPITGRAVDAEVSSTLVIGICCNNCKERFEAEPKAFLGNLKKPAAEEAEG